MYKIFNKEIKFIWKISLTIELHKYIVFESWFMPPKIKFNMKWFFDRQPPKLDYNANLHVEHTFTRQDSRTTFYKVFPFKIKIIKWCVFTQERWSIYVGEKVYRTIGEREEADQTRSNDVLSKPLTWLKIIRYWLVFK